MTAGQHAEGMINQLSPEFITEVSIQYSILALGYLQLTHGDDSSALIVSAPVATSIAGRR